MAPEACSLISEFFKNYSVGEIQPQSGKLILVDDSLSLLQTYKVLAKNSVSSAVFWDSQEGKAQGLVTITDLMIALLSIHNLFFANGADGARMLAELGGARPAHPQDGLARVPLKAWFRARQRFVYVNSRTSIHDALALMFAHGLHHLAVTDGNPTAAEAPRVPVRFVLTYRHVCRFLVSTFRVPARVLHRTLHSVNVGTAAESLITVRETDSVAAALRTLVAHRLSVVPVVDARGVYRDVFSKYDFTFIGRAGPHFMLDAPVAAAVAMRPKSFESAFIASVEFTIGGLIALIAQRNLHRVVVLREDRTIARIISLRHVLAFLLSIELK